MPLAFFQASAHADTIAKTYGSSQAISPGYVVSLSKTDAQNVELASASELNRIYGVVISPSDSPITLETPSRQVVVATSGNYLVYVNLTNGKIKSGDYLSMSSTKGVAAKASDSQSYVLGKAMQSFDGSQGVVAGSGSNASAKIIVQIAPGKNPIAQVAPSVPGPLSKLANDVAGRSVSAIRVYVALGVFLVTLIIAASLIWVGIRTSLISIGRNPLSKHSIMQGLAQVVGAAAVIFIGGLIGIFLLLRI